MSLTINTYFYASKNKENKKKHQKLMFLSLQMKEMKIILNGYHPNSYNPRSLCKIIL